MMIWASRNKFRGVFTSCSALFSTAPSGGGKTGTRSTTLATIFILGATTSSSFYFSSVGKTRSTARNPLLKNDSLCEHRDNNYLIATSSAASKASTESQRTHATTADEYFRKCQQIPLPPVAHDNLERMILSEENQNRVISSTETIQCNDGRILVIGDVHGCLEELVSLVRKAIQEHNDGKQFKAIVLVGDLCNKGPSSAQVVRYVRNRPGWFSVRGNHDDRALSAALGDEQCRSKPKYQWVNALSDDDVTWMSNLPYTITIPKKMLNYESSSENERDVIIVHAGLVPGIRLENQETKTMVTVRNLAVDNNGTASKAWAKIWRGPELVIFGHDAKRGLQREDYAIGLDSGCVYGKKLTGMILPERKIVSVDAVREYCPVEKKKV